MNRSDFLKRLTLTIGGLLVADDALALLVEPRRKLWPGASFEYEPMSMGFSVSREMIEDDMYSTIIGDWRYLEGYAIQHRRLHYKEERWQLVGRDLLKDFLVLRPLPLR